MPDELTLIVGGKPFTGRVDEQRRFERILEDTAQLRGRRAQAEWSRIVLIDGPGGIGKSTLSRRLRDLAEAKHFDVAWFDWEQARIADPALAVHEHVSFETVLEHLTTAFRHENASYQRDFRDFRQARNQQTILITRIDEHLKRRREPDGERSPLWQAGVNGVAALLRFYVRGDATRHRMVGPDLDWAVGKSAEEVEELHREAERLVRGCVTSEEYELLVRPGSTFAESFAAGILTMTRRKPLSVFLDTYEIIDGVDNWLRQVMSQTGPRAVWVICGRRNLGASVRHSGTLMPGYEADVPSDRLFRFQLGEFSSGDIKVLFDVKVPHRPIGDDEADAVRSVTFGIPLAVELAAEIWAAGADLADLGDGSGRPSEGEEEIVRAMAERFLVHAHRRAADAGDTDDLWQLKLLALTDQPDPGLLAAVWDVAEAGPVLERLTARYDFVSQSKMRLHNVVHEFIRDYLLQPLQRAGARVQSANERAVSLLLDRISSRQRDHRTLESRIHDERWVADVRSLVAHRFWLDEDLGWSTLLTVLPAGLAYDDNFTFALIEGASRFVSTWTRVGRDRLEALMRAVSWTADLREQQRAFAELESAKLDPALLDTQSVRVERAAIIQWRRGQSLSRHNRSDLALAALLDAASAAGEAQSLQGLISLELTILADELTWAQGRWRTRPIPTPLALQASQKAVELTPNEGSAWQTYSWALEAHGRIRDSVTALTRATEINAMNPDLWQDLSHAYVVCGLYEPAQAAIKRAIALDPQSGQYWYFSGYLYKRLQDEGKAIETLEHALELDPRHAKVHGSLAALRLARGDIEQARAEFLKGVELGPDDAIYAHVSLGVIARCLGDVQLAKPHFEATVKIARDNPWAGGSHFDLLYTSSLALLCLGRITPALEQLKEAFTFRVPGDYLEPGSVLEQLLLSAIPPVDGLREYMSLKSSLKDAP